MRAKGKGRPLGYLMAWLLAADEADDEWEHKNLFKTFDRASREHARRVLEGLPGAEGIFGQERDRADNEESEPE